MHVHKNLGLSETSVPLNPMVAHHSPMTWLGGSPGYSAVQETQGILHGNLLWCQALGLDCIETDILPRETTTTTTTTTTTITARTATTTTTSTASTTTTKKLPELQEPQQQQQQQPGCLPVNIRHHFSSDNACNSSDHVRQKMVILWLYLGYTP